MKITNEHVGRLLAARLERVQRAGRPLDRTGLEGGSADRAVFSALAEDLRVGLASARSPADGGELATREARLSALTEQVRAGLYQVSAQSIAEAMLRDLRGS